MHHDVVLQVEQYKYMGLMFNNSWNHKSAVKNNADNTRKALHSMYYYLSSRKVPLVLRAMLIRSVLLPMATYGGELFGMIMGYGSSAALSRLRDELKIATVNTKTAVARERAYYKWPTLNTWMPALMAAPMKSRLSTWVSGTTKWVKRYCQGMVPGRTAKALALRARKNDKSKITAWIDQIMAGRIRSVGLLELVYPEYSQSIQSIIKIRSGYFNTMLKAGQSQNSGQAKIADSKYLDHCPCCNMDVAESIEHMIFECTQWSNQRTSTIGTQFPNVNLLVASSTRTRLLGTLLGGELVISTAGLRQLQSSTPAVSNVLSMVHFMSAIFTPRAIILNRIMGAPTSWTQSRGELRITPVNTRASVLRERAYYRWPTLNTWIADLIDNPFKNRISTWITGTKKWVSRFGTTGSYGSARKVLEIRARAKDKSKISEWISKNAIGFSRNLTDLKLLYPEHSTDKYLNKCPFCNKFEPETVEHYLIKCSKWADQRQSILGEYISQPNLIVPGSTCSKLLGTLLGGKLKFNYAGILKTSFEIDVKESHSYTFPTVSLQIACDLLGSAIYKAEIKFKKRRRRTDSERRALPTNSVNDTNQIRQLILWQLNSATYLTKITPEMVTKFTEDEDNLGKKKRLSGGNSTIAPHSFVLVSIGCRLTNAPLGEGFYFHILLSGFLKIIHALPYCYL
ncbi:hypothetical protein BB561_001040 [Smittium simulii]|uniref:Uncharacterized protein n=1 Tax=Smittium simulii TaxID=133385 RepID=A0A2T9YWB9_9FUNG|nr:hypothetical protein BB561_001040 [Smittium simulii]